MGEGPKDLRDETVDPRLRNENIAGPTGDDITGRPLSGLDRPGASEAVGYAGGYAPAVPASSGTTPPASGETAAIRADIEQTRANISDTVDAIQQKLSPSNVMSEATESVKDATRERVRQVADASRAAATRVAQTTRQVSNRAVYVARENPWATAAAVAGVGALAWWLTSRRGGAEYEIDDYEDDILDDMTEESLYFEDFDTEEGRGLMQRMRANALPLVVAGAGVGWWLWSRQSARRASYGSGYDYETTERPWNEAAYGAEAGSYRSFEGGRDWTDNAGTTGRRVRNAVSSAADRARGAVEGAGERARGMMSDAGERARHVVDDVSARTRDYASQASSRVSQAGRQAGSQLSYWMDRNPLAVGAAAMAIGAAVGLALPESRRERELIGPARDRLFDRAQSMAGDVVDRAKQTVQDVASKASDAMNQPGQNQPHQAPNDAGLGKNPR